MRLKHENLGRVLLGTTVSNVTGFGWCGWSVPIERISTVFSWKSWKHGRIPGDSRHQTSTVLNKIAFVNIAQRIRAHDCDSGRYPSFSTNSTGLRVGWNSWSTEPTENGWFPIEHVTKIQPTQPTQYIRLVPIEHDLNRRMTSCSLVIGWIFWRAKLLKILSVTVNLKRLIL